MQIQKLNNEKLLLELIAQGDEPAFRVLFDHYRDKIFTVALKLTKSEISAQEIVQDVFLKIWTGRSKLGTIANFDAYLFIITRNLAFKILKSIARSHTNIEFTELSEKCGSQNASDLLFDKEYDQLLKTAIERLPNQQKKIYKLIKGEGLKREEVAQQLELRPETVKFYLAQAMKNIRAFCLLHLESIIGFLFYSLFF